MSSSSSTSGGFLDGGGSDGGAEGLTYGIGVSVGILILITTITLASYFCTRDATADGGDQRQNSTSNNDDNNNNSADINAHCVVVEIGIDEATLLSYPKMMYSKAKEKLELAKKEDSTASCCSICLADYKDTDVVRILPDCHHVFHQRCVDPWLTSHPTCPVCRTSPLPSPMATPLVEVAPLAANRRN